MPRGKVLSIQSYVVSCYVGGKGVTLVLQTCGYDVDSIYSVIFSNHTAYSRVNGKVVQEQDFSELYNGLKHNNLNNYDFIVSGYMKDYNFASYLSKVVQELKRQNPELLYFFDPVLGDNNKFYCPESFVNLYRSELLPYADVIVPNQFEVEKLSEVVIDNKDSAIMACRNLHRLGVRTVIVSSVEGLSPHPKTLTCVLSEICQQENCSQIKTIFIEFPKFEQSFIGTGDCFSALLIPAFDSKGSAMAFSEKIDAVCLGLTRMNRILQRSIYVHEEEQKVNKYGIPPPKYRPNELALSDCIEIVLDETLMASLFRLSDISITAI